MCIYTEKTVYCTFTVWILFVCNCSCNVCIQTKTVITSLFVHCLCPVCFLFANSSYANVEQTFDERSCSRWVGRGCVAQRGPTNDGRFFVSANFNCFNQELIFSVGGTVAYFKTLWDLTFSKSFFTPTILKLMIYSYQGAHRILHYNVSSVI